MQAILLPVLLTLCATPAARQDTPKFDGDWKIVNKIYVAEPIKH